MIQQKTKYHPIKSWLQLISCLFFFIQANIIQAQENSQTLPASTWISTFNDSLTFRGDTLRVFERAIPYKLIEDSIFLYKLQRKTALFHYNDSNLLGTIHQSDSAIRIDFKMQAVYLELIFGFNTTQTDFLRSQLSNSITFHSGSSYPLNRKEPFDSLFLKIINRDELVLYQNGEIELKAQSTNFVLSINKGLYQGKLPPVRLAEFKKEFINNSIFSMTGEALKFPCTMYRFQKYPIQIHVKDKVFSMVMNVNCNKKIYSIMHKYLIGKPANDTNQIHKIDPSGESHPRKHRIYYEGSHNILDDFLAFSGKAVFIDVINNQDETSYLYRMKIDSAFSVRNYYSGDLKGEDLYFINSEKIPNKQLANLGVLCFRRKFFHRPPGSQTEKILIYFEIDQNRTFNPEESNYFAFQRSEPQEAYNIGSWEEISSERFNSFQRKLRREINKDIKNRKGALNLKSTYDKPRRRSTTKSSMFKQLISPSIWAKKTQLLYLKLRVLSNTWRTIDSPNRPNSIFTNKELAYGYMLGSQLRIVTVNRYNCHSFGNRLRLSDKKGNRIESFNNGAVYEPDDFLIERNYFVNELTVYLELEEMKKLYKTKAKRASLVIEGEGCGVEKIQNASQLRRQIRRAFKRYSRIQKRDERKAYKKLDSDKLS